MLSLHDTHPRLLLKDRIAERDREGDRLVCRPSVACRVVFCEAWRENSWEQHYD